jgi:hypothetical protein
MKHWIYIAVDPSVDWDRWEGDGKRLLRTEHEDGTTCDQLILGPLHERELIEVHAVYFMGDPDTLVASRMGAKLLAYLGYSGYQYAYALLDHDEVTIIRMLGDTHELYRTAEALAARDQAMLDLWEQIYNSTQQDHTMQILQQIEKIEESVGEAFGLDTCDINSVETCRRCVRAGEPADALKMVKGDQGDPFYRGESFLRRSVREWQIRRARMEAAGGR